MSSVASTALETAPHADSRSVIAAMPLDIEINGERHTLRLEPWVTLLDLLRDHLDLTGSKKGCDHGQCGACTVLVDGQRMNACLLLAVSMDGCSITTVEGLPRLAGDRATGPHQLHPLQQAFIDQDALQCGYCTPGQLCSAAGLMNEPAPLNRDEIRERMSGNLCRCGAYPQIVEAVSAVLLRRERAPLPAIVVAQAAMVASPEDTREIRE